MNIKRELIALGVRLLAEHTSLVRKPDSVDLIFASFLGAETHDQRLARELEADLDKAVAASKRALTNHKFRKITKNF